MDELWHNFLISGKAEDYIKYVNGYYKSLEENKDNEINNEGLNYKRTDSWGE